MRSELVAAGCLAAVLSAACGGRSAPTSQATVGEAPASLPTDAASPLGSVTPNAGPPSATPTAEDVPSTAPAAVAEPAAPAVEAASVSFRTVTQETDGYTITVALPVVAGVPPEVATAISEHLAAWSAQRIARFEHEDREFRVPGEDLAGFPPGWLEVRGDSGVPTSALLSVVLRIEEMHQGMAHPWTVVETFTYDLGTGSPVPLTELFAPDQDVLGTVSAAVVPELVARLDPEGSGWAEAGVREGAGADPDDLRRFVVDEGGLTVHFDQYQVAPGAAGPQQVTVPWDALLGRLVPSDVLRRALDAVV